MEDVDRDQLFAWLEDQGILLLKVQVQKLVGEDFQDRVSDLDFDVRLAQQVTQAGQEGHSMGFEEGRAKGLEEGLAKPKSLPSPLVLALCFSPCLGYLFHMWVSHH